MNKIIGSVVLAFFLSSTYVKASDEEEGDPRLGFISVAANGDTSLTFNATSIQKCRLFGGEEDASGYGYEPSGYSSSGYEQPSASGYNTYSKRSANLAGPLLDSLAKAHQKYEEEEE
ncbi:unnamed protein product [Lepeophtheirus salmonis]|uniref:(salmon louse) hypothetical protein n=1 Tax=Lepeophtheirus salmonis TaxID=72036 RepID=A0A7R8CVN0_LEPSM|nr:unnamed protein product [Lepeophtheirus salmonis]CAF2912380.1 unnamed protein product [Lepeophtheirus salmonis]